MNDPSKKSARQAMLHGTLWAVAMRWSTRFIGFISTVVLARLLLPADYAVVAMAMLVVGLIESFFDFGVETAVLRKAEVDDDYVNSAWSLRIIEGVVVGILIGLLSPIAEWYFDDPRVTPVLWILALCVSLCSTGNIGLTLARKSLVFSLDFKVQLISKTLQVAVTVIAAYLLRDYRALVVGVLTGYLSGWALSYLMHAYRPKWNTSAIAEIWLLTRWLMLSNVARFMVSKSDELLAGRVGTAHQYGLYHVGSDLGRMATSEAGAAVLKAFLPVLSSVQHDAQRVRSGVLKVLSIVNSIILPAGFGLAALALPVTRVVFGDNWSAAASIVGLFGVIGALQSSVKPLSTLLILRGFTKCLSRVVWFEFITFAVAAAVLVPLFHLEGLAIARICGSLTSIIMIAYECHRRCGLSLRSSAAAVWRPLCASAFMYFAVATAIEPLDSVLASLVCGITVGVVSYTLLMFASWRLFGRPEGLEHEAVALITARVGRVGWLSK